MTERPPATYRPSEGPVVGLDGKLRTTGYAWGYTYASLVALAAAFHWLKTWGAAVLRLTSAEQGSTNQSVETITFLTGMLAWAVFLSFSAWALFVKHPRSVGIVYAIATGGAIAVLAKGVRPGDLVLWLVVEVPTVIYFRRRRWMFVRQAAPAT